MPITSSFNVRFNGGSTSVSCSTKNYESYIGSASVSHSDCSKPHKFDFSLMRDSLNRNFTLNSITPTAVPKESCQNNAVGELIYGLEDEFGKCKNTDQF